HTRTAIDPAKPPITWRRVIIIPITRPVLWEASSEELFSHEASARAAYPTRRRMETRDRGRLRAARFRKCGVRREHPLCEAPGRRPHCFREVRPCRWKN